jgi:hypothetical protein
MPTQCQRQELHRLPGDLTAQRGSITRLHVSTVSPCVAAGVKIHGSCIRIRAPLQKTQKPVKGFIFDPHWQRLT